MIPHDLLTEFPADRAKIEALKGTDAHFARLVSEYQDLNRAVYDAASRLAPTDEAHEEEMRRKRLALKDEIRRMLQAA